MKLGLIARADNSGLGIQTYEFYRHMQPAKTLVVDIGNLNGNQSFYERYPGATFVRGFPNRLAFSAFLDGLDVVFIAESAYANWFYDLARHKGVKTAVQYNFEFFDWMVKGIAKPDLFIAPSRWRYDEVDEWCKANGVGHTYLHCPVNRQQLKYRPNKKARIFLHPAGKAAAFDRNGTEIVLAASKYLKSDAKIFVHFQGEQGLAHQATNSINSYKEVLHNHGDPSKVQIEEFDYDDYSLVYKDADVLILPRRYGGNCLPLNEALSCGMPVVMTDMSPNNYLLPPRWLIPAVKVAEFTPRVNVDIYGSDPKALAAKIDELYNMSESAFYFENVTAHKIAQTISWQALKPEYERVLGELCNTR